MELRFDDRVAIVTGAGSSPGLGRSYAKYLAQRGARVLINDFALEIGDDGLTCAQRVVKEINEDGGLALADHHSCAEPESAKAIVDAVLDAWGRVDILINNAGVIIPAPFEDITDDDIVRTVNVHLMGHIWMCRAVWGPMAKQGYGRILNTSSNVMLGLASQVVYGAAKGGVFSLTRGLSIEGAPVGILVNSLCPSAGTAGARKLAEDDDSWMQDVFIPNFSPDLVAPTAAFLVHDSCSLTAQWIASSGGKVASGFFSKTVGIDDRDIDIEGVRERLGEILDHDANFVVPEPIDYNRSSSFKPRAYKK